MGALLNLGLSLGEDLSHLRGDDLRELCLVFSQGVPEVRKELGSFVNRELAKRLKALVGPHDDFLCLHRCEVRECFDLLTSRRIYSCKSCLSHICSLSRLVHRLSPSRVTRLVRSRSRPSVNGRGVGGAWNA